jgi:hypothetical protein
MSTRPVLILVDGLQQRQPPCTDRLPFAQLNPKVDHELTATVDFKNAPHWLKTAVDTEGKFKRVTVKKTNAQNATPGQSETEHQAWAY